MTDQSVDVPHLLSLMRIEVTHRFEAPIAKVWGLLSDVERMAGLGPEHMWACWCDEQRGPEATFTGKNRRGDMEWEVPCYVTEYDPPRRFTWTVLEPSNPSSRWSYELTPDGENTIVVQRFEHGPNYSFLRLWAEEHPDNAKSIIEQRGATLKTDMKTTLTNAARLLIAGERPAICD